MTKHIILLNGPSSSGKSTLAKALKQYLEDRFGRHYETVSIDDFLKMNTEDTIYEDDVYEISGILLDHVIRALQDADGVIVDHVITSRRIFEQVKDTLKPYSLLPVHVTCPLHILKLREEARGNRSRGSAAASYEYLYPKDGYDATVDTHCMSKEDCCRLITEKLYGEERQ